jgi:hypothetical protein
MGGRDSGLAAYEGTTASCTEIALLLIRKEPLTIEWIVLLFSEGLSAILPLEPGTLRSSVNFLLARDPTTAESCLKESAAMLISVAPGSLQSLSRRIA